MKNLYNKNWEYLSDLNEYMLKWFLRELGIKTQFLKASEYTFQGTKSDLVLDMCKQLKTDVYIFGTLGKDYTNVRDFENNNIKIIFQDYKHPIYNQLHSEFKENISIIDLLFNCGPDSYNILMSNNISQKDLLK